MKYSQQIGRHLAGVLRELVESDLQEWSGGPKFARAGSALRASSKSNPRSFPCPTCKEPNRLTPADKAKGYQCDSCANRDEGVGYGMNEATWKRQPSEDIAKKHGYVFHRNTSYATVGSNARHGKGKVYLHKGTGHHLTAFDDHSWEHEPTSQSGLQKTNSRLTPDLDAHLKKIHSTTMKEAADGTAIHRLGIHHGRASFNKDTGMWHHTDRPKWFAGTPEIKSKSREEVHRKAIEQGERLYGKKESGT